MRLGPVVVALTALVLVPASAHAQASSDEQRLPLPFGWQPEGIATGPGDKLYVGSVATGDVLTLDVSSGQTKTVFRGARGDKANGLERSDGRVVVTGNDTGEINVFDERTRKRTFTGRPAPDGEDSFTNDVAFARGRAYVTDSSRPAIYSVRLTRNGARVMTQELSGIDYEEGINLNGIVAAPDGRSLYAVQSNVGKLYRITPGRERVREVRLRNKVKLLQGDGIERLGNLLFVVQNRLNRIRVLQLSSTGNSARLVRTIASDDFDVPTTIAFRGGGLYAVNARFGTENPAQAAYWVTSFAGG